MTARTTDKLRNFGESADAEIASFVARANGSDLSSVPSLSAFQRQMEAYPQLSNAAQVELTQKVREGREAEDKLLRVRKEENRRALERKVREGRRAADYLVGANFRLVLLISSERIKERFGMDRVADRMPDVVAEANVALAEAIVNYEEDRCPQFSTYAARVIRDHVHYVVSREGSIKVAASWTRMRRIAVMRIQVLTEEHGRKPTDDELKADLLNHCMKWAYDRLSARQQQLPKEKREELQMAKLRKQGMLGAIQSINDVLLAGQSVTSLDTPVGEDGGGSLGDLVQDSNSDFTSDIEFEELSATLNAALSDLEEREQIIIRMRFGIGTKDEETFTYAEIGKKCNVSAERIRQIERSVLDRLATDASFREALTSHLPGLS